ncbi:MAG: HD domain-containing protein, partial [Anaerolineae bacterium]|nr:HD domain-containing protein [Anaerolineae bacterium]
SAASDVYKRQQHTVIGANILDHVAFSAPGVSFLRMAATVARFHHERFDGNGYPTGLSGTMIPLPARIAALADAYDAITSIRPYKTAQPPAAAREIIRKDSGSHFDPVIVDAFLRRFDAIVSVQRQTEDRFPLVIGAAALRPEHSAPTAPFREYATV